MTLSRRDIFGLALAWLSFALADRVFVSSRCGRGGGRLITRCRSCPTRSMRWSRTSMRRRCRFITTSIMPRTSTICNKALAASAGAQAEGPDHAASRDRHRAGGYPPGRRSTTAAGT